MKNKLMDAWTIKKLHCYRPVNPSREVKWIRFVWKKKLHWWKSEMIEFKFGAN